MAKFRAADPPASRKIRQPMMQKGEAVMATDEYGEDPWAMVASRDVCRKSAATPLAAYEPIKTDSGHEDEVALPTPIAQGPWKVTAPDGREELTYQPIPGFEHLLHGRSPPQGLPSYQQSAIVYQPPLPAVASQAPVARRQQKTAAPKRKTLKRSRSAARGQTQQRVQAPIDDEEDDYDDDDDIRATNETSYTFYIGDLVELTKFFRRRLEELTMKPLRPIVTAWIKQLEPRRLGAYGPYHKQLPSQQPPECTPPWWPGDVPYEEPSHLDKTGLLKLAVDVMLQHRIIDEPKRRGSWVAKLRQAAQYAIETTPPEQFSSSKGSGFSELMRERALNEIMPTLFDIAQSYEDHFVQNDLYEGSGNIDPQNGRTCTWQTASRPPRQPLHRKRMRRARANAPAREESDFDASGDSTEVDDTVSNTFLRRERVRTQKPSRTSKNSANTVGSSRKQTRRTPILPSGTRTPVSCSRSSISTPNTSFDRNMSGLYLGADADTDVKSVNHAQFAEQQALMCNMYALGQPMQYSTSQPSYNNHSFPLQEHVGAFSNSAQPPFVAGPGPGFVQYPMYNTPYPPQVDNSAFPTSIGHNHPGFPYECEQMFPPVSTPGSATTSFNGLPMEFVVDGPRSAHH